MADLLDHFRSVSNTGVSDLIGDLIGGLQN